METVSVNPSIIATDVSYEEYMAHYAEQFCEWVDGTVIKLPENAKHNTVKLYLSILFETYLSFLNIGVLRTAAFVMRLPSGKAREPDLQIILNTNPGVLTETSMNGAADLCIEIVSPESQSCDYGDKFTEYEAGGVREYWIVDPLRQDFRPYQLNEAGVYIPFREDADGNYRTALLPDFVLHVPDLWQEPLPVPAQIVQSVQAMLGR